MRKGGVATESVKKSNRGTRNTNTKGRGEHKHKHRSSRGQTQEQEKGGVGRVTRV